ncbi:MAG TPA: histidine kinase [Gaiellaceae bacterium]
MDVTALLLAEDEERRSLERLLHDGAQQRLTALVVQLQLALRSLPDDAGDAAAQLADVRAELGEAIDELRELAARIHPQHLDTLGHTVALKAVARIDGEIPEPLPLEVAVTAYRLCASGGGAVVRAADGALRLEIVGNAAAVERLRPRVEALGGTFLLEPGRITATLPLRPPRDT